MYQQVPVTLNILAVLLVQMNSVCVPSQGGEAKQQSWGWCQCVKERIVNGLQQYGVWIEGSNGGCAVKGTVETIDMKDR